MTKRKTYMNGAKERMARWHALLRHIITGLELIKGQVSEEKVKKSLETIREQIDILDEDLQNRRVVADNYQMVMKLDIPFTQKFLQEADVEILIEALRGQHGVIVKLLDAIERAKTEH